MKPGWKLIALIAAAPLAQAADETGKGYILPQAGWVWTDSDRNVDDDWYYGFGVGKHVSERWSVEINGTRGRYDGEGGGHLDLTTVSLDGLRVFKRPEQVSPFVSFGIGYMEDNPQPGRRSKDWLGQVGTGLLVDVAENERGSFLFQLRPEIKVRWDGNDTSVRHHAVDYMAGLSFVLAFGPERPVERTAVPRRTEPAPAVQPAPEPKPEPAPKPAPPPPAPVVLEGVNFENNSATLTAESRPVLIELASELRQHPRLKLEVQGHTDSNGAAAYNLDLSQRRADAVKDYLVREGVPAARLISRGYGETRPTADNGTPAGRAANRRVVMEVVENPEGVRIRSLDN